ncbi:MAG: flotillin family protein [Pseudobacteriovorax sp.]|nr:flotillin family protein [Pseudobacteriovorax sp.]
MENVFINSGIVIFASVSLFILGIVFFITRFLRKVEPGKALIIINPFKKNMAVSFTGGVVIPVIHRAEVMDISTKQVVVERRGKDGLICKDNIRADISVNFYIRVNNTVEDVRNVAQSIGVDRASQKETLDELFQAKFSEALKTVGKKTDFEELFQERALFKEKIVQEIGQNLNGYSLEDTAIDYLEQTGLEFFEPNNIQDAAGIKKIIDITLELKEQKEKRETEATERILELDRQRAEAKARQEAEIAILQARENAEQEKIIQEERQKAELAKIRVDEELRIAAENMERQVEVAKKSKERTVAVETERVEKERDLEKTDREKLVALADIEKVRAVEDQKKTIQEIIRQRVALERSVAEEEEKTKDTVALATANRNKTVQLTAAEANAEEKLVTEIKSAEAKEKAAKYAANEMAIRAEAELATSNQIADAKKILAEGIIAESAAVGLSEVKVKEADADAVRKLGEAEAHALTFKSRAEAEAIREKGTSEAQIIADKAKAMHDLDEVGREHEEFKARLNVQQELALEKLTVSRDIAKNNAQVISKALENAKIDIVGGDQIFFDKLISAVSNSKSIEARFPEDGVLNQVKDVFLSDGNGELMTKLRGVIDTLGVGSKAMKDYSIAGLLNKLHSETKDSSIQGVISGLLKDAESAGINDQSSQILFNK